MLTTIILALIGAAATGGSGYLFGARAGKKAREGLESELSRSKHQVAEFSQELSQAHARAATLEESLAHEHRSASSGEQLAAEVRSLLSPIVGAQEAATRNLQVQLRELAERVDSGDDGVAQLEALRSELQQTLAPLVAQDRENHKMMLDVLGPLMERERRAQGLTLLSPNRRGRHHLPRLLDMLVRRGGFATVLLSDEMGLPLAASSGARDADVIAGVSSLVFTLADRVASSGAAAPMAVLLRDSSNQRILHRIFTVEKERFLVTAVAKGNEIATDALDPALAALEDILGPQAA